MSVLPVVVAVLGARRPANTQCADSGCPGSSDAPTFALIALLIVAVVLLVLAVRIWVRGRRGDQLFASVSAVLVGVAVVCLVLFGSGFRHFGPTDDDNVSACSPWWQEAGLPAAAQGVASDDPTVNCREQAIDAIGPALGEGGVAGVVVGGLVFAGLRLVRRRDRPDRPRYAYSDHAVQRNRDA